ncbi:TfuA-like protein [Streptantibioticus rubrisoli]|uniref:TfuA-like protein n=1 Tax=Streptantibioticus rubrisoli TaxID=1387313 RepID=A0ABT1PBM6_9ACTN|nr:TfuA-like protein [Streptantibioticus rubrisoli]MCQ4042779.1 TfuA-like protein [Streptantibioticus rubrisoli]
MRRFLFSGPSLPDARQVVGDSPIEVLPPVAAGDLLRLPLRPGDAVGIVDGYFHQTRTVRHKEILAVLSAGVRVLGAASMGALRAAELHRFGMIGIGGIYRDFQTGALTADDEVTLAHGDADSGYRAGSIPLVCLRATLARAERRGLLSTALREAVIERLARSPYPLRTCQAVESAARSCGLETAAAHALGAYCDEHLVDVKREDALLLVEALRAEPEGSGQPAPPLTRTSFLYSWQLLAVGTDTGDGHGWVSDLALLRACQILDPSYPDAYRRFALGRLAQDCRRECADAQEPDPARAAVAHGTHRGLYPPLDSVADFDFLADWLTKAERGSLDRHEQVERFLIRSFRIEPGIIDDMGALAALRESSEFAAARRVVTAADQVNRQARELESRFGLETLNERRIVAWLAERWGVSDDEELELHALDRGLGSVSRAVAAARPVYLLARHRPSLAELTAF